MMFKPQVGPRAVSASSSRIMSSVVFMKDTGILCLFLSGLLLLPVFVSGVTAEMSTTSSTTDSVTGSEASTTTMLQVSTMEKAQTEANPQISSSTVSKATKDTSSTQSNTTVSGNSTVNPTQSIMSTTYGGTAMSTAAPSSTTTLNSEGPTSISTLSASSTLPSSSTHSASPTSGGSSPYSTHSPPTTSGGSALHSTHSVSSTLQDGMTAKNTTSNSSMDMIYCPSFSCNYSDCYSMYNSQNASACASGESCQLLRSMDMWYSVSCSASCAESCSNTTQTTCAVNCCNSTGCLNDSFASMMMKTTVAATTTTKASPTTTTSTTANNGKKCQKGTCTGENCYENFKSEMPETCSSMQPHCQLKKESSDSGVVWKAGCSNCTGYSPCRGSTTRPCHLECCTATTTSCLMLNGTLNVPSFATRGPHLHRELITSLLCLLALTLLL